MDLTELTHRSNYARKLGIEFLGPDEPDRWPKTHQKLFADVQTLGRERFSSFMETITIDSIEKPWRKATPKRAVRLSELAKLCYREYRNEEGWRFEVENEIMRRFTVEVACPHCRNRLWESEIPAATDSIHRQAQSLEERRRNRKPCQCPKGWGDNEYDGGINMLFSSRAEARIVHEPPLKISSQPLKFKHWEEPDRIFGLRQTANLRFLLDSADKRHVGESDASLRESIVSSPFSAEPEPLLFPFLMIEAKSSKGAPRVESQMQSAFCMQRLLKLQHDLVIATGDETQWKTGPLVWLFTTRGEQWDLCAGFVEGSDPSSIRSPIVDLWSGDIRDKDDSLQLLLIIDYIFDWARDIYRGAILNELNILATGEISGPDPDVFSTWARRMSYISSWVDASHHTETTEDSFIPEGSDFLNVILPEGVIRDASIIESQYISLQITEDDVDSFLLSFSSAQEAKDWLQSALKCFSSSWRVSSETLRAMESIWTGESRPRRENYLPEQIFHVNVVILMFMTDNWEPVRQLTSLAISDGALQTLILKAGYDRTFRFVDCPEVGKSSIESILERVLKQSILDNLTAAVSMLCLSSCFYRQQWRIDYHLLVKRSGGVSAGFRIERSPHLLPLVHHVYLSHKIGQIEPIQPYICFSRLQSRNTIEYRGTTIEMWPQLPGLVSGDGDQVVLVDGISPQNDSPKRGLFVFRESAQLVDYHTLSGLVHRVSREGLYFKTLQLDLRRPFTHGFQHLNSPVKFKQEWKEKADPESFLRWKERLESMGKHQGPRLGDRPTSPIEIYSDGECDPEGFD